MLSLRLSLCALLLAGSRIAAQEPSAETMGVSVKANPQQVCLDPTRPSYLNFDLVLRNGTEKAVTPKQVLATVLNSRGDAVERRVVTAESNFLAPSKAVEPQREGLLYNPILFASVNPRSAVRFEVQFAEAGLEPVTVTVTPSSCVSKSRLILPLSGRVLVSDGHDLFSHHRRFNYGMPFAKKLGITDNFMRYALDLAVVDAEGREFTGTGTRNQDYYGWGRPVRAAGAGVVVATHNRQPDNDPGRENRWTMNPNDEMSPAGNYVLIDHGNGEFSFAAHLKQGSVKVRKGDRVRAGDLVGAVWKFGLVARRSRALRTAKRLGGSRNFIDAAVLPRRVPPQGSSRQEGADTNQYRRHCRCALSRHSLVHPRLERHESMSASHPKRHERYFRKRRGR